MEKVLFLVLRLYIKDLSVKIDQMPGVIVKICRSVGFMCNYKPAEFMWLVYRSKSYKYLNSV